MNSNIRNTKEISNDIIYNVKTENNQINQIQNTNGITQEASKPSLGSKLLAFIKAKPIIFSLIVIGTTAVIVTAVAVPVVIMNKDKTDNNSNDITLESSINTNIPDNTGSNNSDDNKNNDNDNNEESKTNNDGNKNNDNDNNEESKTHNDDNKNNGSDNNEESQTNNEANNAIFDFSNININSQYYNIGDKSSSLTTFCQYLEEISPNFNDKQKVYYIYKWVAENIEYDYEKYKNNMAVECEPEQVITNRKTVCSGYARLFTKLLKCMQYPENNIVNVIGHSKGLGYDIEKVLTDESTDHEWNAVKLEDNWCLIDVTWGAGSIVNEAFQKSYTEYYLCTPPTQFVRSHLPKHTQTEYQVLKNPIDIPTFKNLAPTTTTFFEYGFISIENDQAIQNICGEGKIVLKNKSDIRPIIFPKIENKENWIMEEKITNGYDINFSINEQGTYDLEVGANIDNGNSYKNIVSFKINCESAPETKKIFPELTLDYKKDNNIKLISPIDNDLEQSQSKKCNFKIESSDYDELYLLVDQEFILMDKDGTIFTENNVMIHGNSVKISYLNSNDENYYPLVQYSTSGTTIEFPQSSLTTFKKRLESPLKNTLKIGEEYNFKIIYEGEYNIKIKYNNEWTDLEKNGNIYSKQITIESSIEGSQLKVMYGPIEGYYYSMYTYNISN